MLGFNDALFESGTKWSSPELLDVLTVLWRCGGGMMADSHGLIGAAAPGTASKWTGP